MSGFKLEQFTTAGDAVLEYFRFSAENLLFEKTAPLADAIYLTLIAFSTLVWIMFGVMWMFGKVHETKDEMMKSAFLIMITSSITVGVYQEWVIIPVLDLSNNLAVFFTDSNQGTVFESIDKTFGNILGLGWDLIKSGGMMNLSPVFSGLAIVVMYGVCYAVYALVVIFSHFVLSIFFILGILLIKLSIFKCWRPVLKSWGQAVLKFSLVPVFATIIVIFSSSLAEMSILSIIDKTTIDWANYKEFIDKTDVATTYEYFVLILTAFVTIYLLMKTIETVSELTGGVANDMSGSIRGAVGGAKATYGAAKISMNKMAKNQI